MLYFLILAFFGFSNAMADLVPTAQPEFILQRDSGRLGKKMEYSLHRIALEDKTSEVVLNFEYEGNLDAREFLVVTDEYGKFQHVWIIGYEGRLRKFSSQGVVDYYTSLGPLHAISPGPDGSLLYITRKSPKLLQQLNANGTNTIYWLPGKGQLISYDARFASGIRVVLQGTLAQGNEVIEVSSGANISQHLISLSSLQSHLSPSVVGYMSDVALIRADYRQGGRVVPAYALDVPLGGTRQTFLLQTLPLQLLDVEKGIDNVTVWLRSSTGLHRYKLDKSGVTLNTYEGAFKENQLAEMPSGAGRFRYRDAEKLNADAFSERIRGAESAQPKIEHVETSSSVELKARVRNAISEEIIRLNRILRYIGHGDKTMSSDKWIRALRGAAGGEFWSKSLFAELDVRELLENPVTMDELVEELQRRLPAPKLCELQLTSP